MAHPLFFIVPSLVVGGLVGFVAAESRTDSSRGEKGETDSSRAERAAESTTSLFGGDDSIDYDRVARACLRARGSSAALPERGEPEGAPRLAVTPEQQREALSTLERVEELALEHGVWSRLAGFRAQALLEKLPADEGRAFEERLSERIQQGVVKPQAGAWFPGGEEH